MWEMWRWEIGLTEAVAWVSGNGRLRGRRGTGGDGLRGHWRQRGGNFCVELLVPVGGAAVAEGPDALPALRDVEGASGAGVGHGDVPEAVLTAAALQLLLVMILWRQKNTRANND